MENKNYNELQEIIKNGNWKEMHESFGCHLATKVDAKYLDKRAFDVIQRCKVWIANWETIRQGIEPELRAKRAEQLDEKAKELESYSQEELNALIAKVQQLKTA